MNEWDFPDAENYLHKVEHLMGTQYQDSDWIEGVRIVLNRNKKHKSKEEHQEFVKKVLIIVNKAYDNTGAKRYRDFIREIENAYNIKV